MIALYQEKIVIFAKFNAFDTVKHFELLVSLRAKKVIVQLSVPSFYTVYWINRNAVIIPFLSLY